MRGAEAKEQGNPALRLDLVASTLSSFQHQVWNLWLGTMFSRVPHGSRQTRVLEVDMKSNIEDNVMRIKMSPER